MNNVDMVFYSDKFTVYECLYFVGFNGVYIGDLDLYTLLNEEVAIRIEYLPDNIEITGDVDLEGHNLHRVPANFKVGGHIDLDGTFITELPKNLCVVGDLDIRNTLVKELPDDIKVGNTLIIYDTPLANMDFLVPSGVVYVMKYLEEW